MLLINFINATVWDCGNLRELFRTRVLYHYLRCFDWFLFLNSKETYE